MAEKRISELTAKGSNLESTDLLEVSIDAGGGSYATRYITGAEITGAVSSANFANTNLTFTANRTHDIGAFELKLDGTVKTISPGATSGDTAFSVRNSLDNADMFKMRGDGVGLIGSLAIGAVSSTFPVIGSSGDGFFEALFIGATQEIRIKDTGVISLGGGFTTIRQNNYNVNLTSYYATQVKNYTDPLIVSPPSTVLDLQGTSGFLLLPRMNATQASAHTPTDGHVGYITTTNGTFTSVGIWGYESGAWVKL